MIGGDVQDVVRATADRHVRQIQWLCIHPPIYGGREQLTELGAIHVRMGQNRFLRELAGTGIVVVIRGYVHLRMRRTAERAQYDCSQRAKMMSACFHSKPQFRVLEIGPSFLSASRLRDAPRCIHAI